MPNKIIEQNAISFHSRIADSFARAYEPAPAESRSAWNQLFSYSRERLDQYLYPALRHCGRRILDVGCGSGHYVSELRRQGFDVAGVDASPEMVNLARRENPGADIREGMAEHLPFEDETFDGVICIEVLRYLEDPVACMKELMRVLKPQGICIVTALPRLNLNGYWFVNRIDSVVPVRGLKHLRQYFTSPRQLRKQFENHGFQAIDIRGLYFGPTSWFGRLAPGFVLSVLRICEPIDRQLSRVRQTAPFSNMLFLTARKSR